MDQRTIRVDGIPTDFAQERVRDKLMIHFLRSRNGGGDIVDIAFPPEYPLTALITFEKAEVAQQVLRIGTHILSANEKEYPLTVMPHYTDVNPDEIFVRVSMTIDYGRLPDGKRTMRNLKKTFRDVHLNFDFKDELCTVKGTYTDIQELSKEILNILDPGKKSIHISEKDEIHKVNSLRTDTMGSADIPKKVSQQRSTKKDDGLQALEHELASAEKLHSSSLEALADEQDHERTVEGLEDFSLMMDSDIYTYMHTFHKDKYQQILYQHRAEAVDVSSNGITTLFLQAASESSSSVATLRRAHHSLQDLYQELEGKLRKEQIGKIDLEFDKSLVKEVADNIQTHFPQVLLHEDKNCFYIIGSSVDVSQAKQLVLDLRIKAELSKSTRREKTLSAHSDFLDPSSSKQFELEPGLEQQLRNSSSPRPDVRKDTKLAANFSTPKSEQHTGRSKSIAGENVLLRPGQSNVKESSIKEVNRQKEHLFQNEKDLPLQVHTRQEGGGSDGDMGSSLGPQVTEDSKSPNKANEDAVLKKCELFSISARGKGNKPLQITGNTRSLGPIKPYQIISSSNSLLHLDLGDTTQAFRAADSDKISVGFEFRNTLKRANSFSGVLKSKEDRNSGSAQAANDCFFTEEIPLDTNIWSYLKFVYPAHVKSICSKEGAETTEAQSKDVTTLTFKGQNKSVVSSVKTAILSLYLKEAKNLASHHISYSELGVESSADEVLDNWCSQLESSYETFQIKKGSNDLHIIGPKSQCWKVAEELMNLSKNRFHYTQQTQQPSGISHDMGVSLGTMPPLSEKHLTNEYLNAGSSSVSLRDQRLNVDKTPNTPKPGSHHSDVSQFVQALSSQYPAKGIEDLTWLKDLHQNESSPFYPRAEGMELSSTQRRAPKNVQRTNTSQIAAGQRNMDNPNQILGETWDAASNSAKELFHYSDQKQKVDSGQETFSSENPIGKMDPKDQHWIGKQTTEMDLPKANKALPDKFPLLNNKKRDTNTEELEGLKLHALRVDSGPQSLPAWLSSTHNNLVLPKNTAVHSNVPSGSKPSDQLKLEEHGIMNNDVRLQDQNTLSKFQQRSPAVGEDAQDLRILRCPQCNKQDSSMIDAPCGHFWCRNCILMEQTCRACTSTSTLDNSNNGIKGSMTCTTLSSSLPGYSRDLTLKITYDIPDGIQGAGDPNPGKPFKGGRFEAYLPYNKEGQKVFQLLKKAFDQGLTFKVQADDRVALSKIPHKTSFEGGISKSGYPDSRYLKEVCDILRRYGVE